MSEKKSAIVSALPPPAPSSSSSSSSSSPALDGKDQVASPSPSAAKPDTFDFESLNRPEPGVATTVSSRHLLCLLHIWPAARDPVKNARQYDSVSSQFSVSDADVRALTDPQRTRLWEHVYKTRRLDARGGAACGVYSRGANIPFAWVFATQNIASRVSGASSMSGIVM